MSDDLPTPPPPPNPPGGGAGDLIPINIEDEMRKSYLDYSMSRHHRARAARRARRPEAGAPPHPLRDARRGAAPQPQVQQVRRRRRRGAEEVPPARRRVASTTRWSAWRSTWNLRYLLVDGQGNFGCVDGDSAGGLPLHRVPDDRARRRAARRHRQGDRRLRAELRRLHQGAAGPPDPLPEPAGQRRSTASRSAWPPTSRRTTWARSSTPRSTSSTTRSATIRDLMQLIPGPDFPTARHSSSAARASSEAYATGRGSITPARPARHRDVDEEAERETHRHHRDPVPGEQGPAHRADRRAGQGQEDRGHLPTCATSRDRDGHAARHRAEARRHRAGGAEQPLRQHRRCRPPSASMHAGHRRRPARGCSISRRSSSASSSTAARSSPGAAASSCARRRRRLHIVEGLLVAQDIIDLVITIIRRSKDPDEARWGLMNMPLAGALRARALH